MTAMFLGLSLVAGAPALKGPARDDPPSIEGLWELQEWYISGQSTGVIEGSTTEFRPKGVRILTQGAGDVPDERGYKLHPNTKPAHIDYIRPSGGGPPDIFLGIYKIEDDILTITLGNVGDERPKFYEHDKAGSWTVMKFKRAKKK